MRKAGIKQRQSSGAWEQLTNRQQRRITRAFDEWSAKARRILNNLAKDGATIEDQRRALDKSLRAFERTMIQIYTRGIDIVKNASAGSKRDLPEIIRLADTKKREGERMITQNLIPLIAAGLLPAITAGAAFDSASLRNEFLSVRSMPAQYAGGAWVMIFETQRTLGYAREAERLAQGLPIEKVRWVLDPHAEHCEDSAGYHGCINLAGEYNSWRSLPTVPAGQVTCRGNCILPGNRIDITNIQAAIRACYSGPAIKFVTESGVEFAVTANHPVLTPERWLAAQFLNEGDYVVKSTFGKVPVMLIDNDHQDMPSLVEKVWGALIIKPRIDARPGAPIMTDDFHSDGRFMYGDVDIILPYSTLRSDIVDPPEEQALHNSLLHRGLLAEAVLSAQGPRVKVINRPLTTSDRLVISSDLPTSLCKRHLIPFNLFGLASSTQMNSLSFESVGDSPSAYMKIMRQLQETFARQISLDKVVDIIKFDYSGHVYDYQSDCGYYLLNSSLSQREGIVNSNCRCHLEVFRDGKWQRGVYE